MQKNQPLVSVIMPVYNAENYLKEAIESVIAQSYTNWELLAVDDGSTDHSISIIKSYSAKDYRIKLFKNESNEHGPGIARNYGIERISGKYTYFIDSDDWIEKDLLYDTVNLAEKTGADIVPFGFIIEDNGKKVKKPLKPSGNFEYHDLQKIANDILRGTWSECHELIRSELLHDVRHNKYKTCEDICFQMDLLCKVKKICGIDKEYYHYRVVNGSISHTGKWAEDFLKTSIEVCKKEIKFLEYCGLNEDSQLMKNAVIERYSGCLYWLCTKTCPLTLRERYNQIKCIGDAVFIKKYKQSFSCSSYSGMKKIAKLFVKYNMEIVIIIFGKLYYEIFDTSNK